MTHRVGTDNIEGPPSGVIWDDLNPPLNWWQRFVGFLGALFAGSVMVFTMAGWYLVIERLW